MKCVFNMGVYKWRASDDDIRSLDLPNLDARGNHVDLGTVTHSLSEVVFVLKIRSLRIQRRQSSSGWTLPRLIGIRVSIVGSLGAYSRWSLPLDGAGLQLEFITSPTKRGAIIEGTDHGRYWRAKLYIKAVLLASHLDLGLTLILKLKAQSRTQLSEGSSVLFSSFVAMSSDGDCSAGIPPDPEIAGMFFLFPCPAVNNMCLT